MGGVKGVKGRIAVVGAGGVAAAATAKIAKHGGAFKEMYITSRRLGKCEELRESILARGTDVKVEAAALDAEDVGSLTAVLGAIEPELVLNLALPYHDLNVMEACLRIGANYVDTANYEPVDDARFEYGWQWAYAGRFKEAGLTALLGCGFDPGVTGVFCAHALKHHYDAIHTVDILDANGGDHGHPFATNFNPEINIREVTAKGRYWEDGNWVETEPMAIRRSYDFEGIGVRDMYLLYHEELESLAKNIPGLRRIRFFMTFGESYLTHLRCLQNVGMTSIVPIEYEGAEIVPLKFLKAVLPDPASLGPRTTGKTNIGCVMRGVKDGRMKDYRIYNVCDHRECYLEVGTQAISYTTGVPAMIGSMLLMTGVWGGAGVYNVEDLDPDPFMEALGAYGLPWKERFDPEPVG